MKIGFSFGRCVRSIVRGDVALDDVLVIIARTRMPDEHSVKWVIDEYMYRDDYLYGLDQAECERVGLELFNSGRILEPRANGISAGMSVPRDYIWMDLFPTAPDGVASDAVKMAWNHYRMLISLTEQLPEEGFVPQSGPKLKPITEEEKLELQRAAQMLANSI
jgi:hypothetical protein